MVNIRKVKTIEKCVGFSSMIYEFCVILGLDDDFNIRGEVDALNLAEAEMLLRETFKQLIEDSKSFRINFVEKVVSKNG